MNTCTSSRCVVLTIALLLAAGLVGCSGRVSIMPNADKSLNRTPAQFAAEAAKHTYQPDLPAGGPADARAQVAYEVNQLQLINLSEEDWHDVEIWVNHKYVVYVPRFEAGKKRVKTVTFLMLYDNDGNPFPADNSKQMINSLEMVRDGAKYDIPLALAD